MLKVVIGRTGHPDTLHYDSCDIFRLAEPLQRGEFAQLFYLGYQG